MKQASNKAPPKFFVQNMLDFVSKDHIQPLKNIVGEFREECVRLQKLVSRPRNDSSRKGLKEARRRMANLAQLLVVSLVEYIEKHGALKQAVFSHDGSVASRPPICKASNY